MFAVIYRSYIKLDREEEYQKLWHKIATYFIGRRSNELPDNIRHAIITIKNCVDQERKLPEIAMELVEDLLLGGYSLKK